MSLKSSRIAKIWNIKIEGKINFVLERMKEIHGEEI